MEGVRRSGTGEDWGGVPPSCAVLPDVRRVVFLFIAPDEDNVPTEASCVACIVPGELGEHGERRGAGGAAAGQARGCGAEQRSQTSAVACANFKLTERDLFFHFILPSSSVTSL